MIYFGNLIRHGQFTFAINFIIKGNDIIPHTILSFYIVMDYFWAEIVKYY
jgi:hypothetical protein